MTIVAESQPDIIEKSAQAAPLRVLLVAGTSPGEPGVGGVILRDLVSTHGAENMHACWLNPNRDKQPHYIPELATTFFERRYETGWRPISGPVGELISCVATKTLRRPLVNRAVQGVQQQVAQFKPDVVLCVLESGMAVQVMARLVKSLTIPVRTIVWDDVDTFCPDGNLDHWTRITIAKDFKTVLQASECVAVICENMQAAYQRDYGIDSFVLRHGMPQVEGASSRSQKGDDVLRIGFAGSITTPDCIRSFISTLDGLGWNIAGRKVCLRMLGARFQLGTLSKQWIEYLGWRDVSETRDLLGECDLLYLPQSFEPKLRHLSELSFPTKLSTYVAARRPILLQAPEYASLREFWARYPLGPVIESLDAKDVQSGIEAIVHCDDAQQANWLQTIAKAHEEALSEDLFRQGVNRLLAPQASSRTS
ncbi:MAG: hypothetical protein KDA88_12400 [Planctomycetaceae bacterium]|nr:hypothetical protein [Planctomycetaceae bacterium]MCB9952029.1 hypothetical protein [Planctomycetaceae bacterium]